MMSALSLGLSLLCAALCAYAPWPARWLPTFAVAMALGIGIVAAVAGAVLSVAPYPWTNLVVWLIALSGGLLLGRAMPPRFLPLLILLLALSVVDLAQVVLTSPGPAWAPSTLPPGVLYGNFRILFSSGHFNIGIGDLLILTTLAETWRRRGGSCLIALFPGLIGLLFAYGFLALTGIGDLPLFPYITAGWLMSEFWYRITRRSSVISKGSGVTH